MGCVCVCVFLCISQVKMSPPAISALHASRPSPAPGSCSSMPRTHTASASTWTHSSPAAHWRRAWRCRRHWAPTHCPARRWPASWAMLATPSTCCAWPRHSYANPRLRCLPRRATWRHGCQPRPSWVPRPHRATTHKVKPLHCSAFFCHLGVRSHYGPQTSYILLCPQSDTIENKHHPRMSEKKTVKAALW